MRPTININFSSKPVHICQLFSVCNNWSYNNCSIVPSLFHFTVLTFSLLHYSTELHYTKYKSGFSANLSKSPKQNEHQFYKIKSGITECIRNQVKLFLSKSKLCISNAQAFQLTIYFLCCSKGPVMK